MRITVVIPAYNGARWIAQAIDSALAQSAPPHEIVVVDDGSEDSTADIARSRPGVRVIPQARQGTAAARNRGIHEAAGDWIALLDQDDYFLPDKLLRQRQILEQHPGAVAAYSGLRKLVAGGPTADVKATPPQRLWPALRCRSLITPSTLLVSKEALDAVGGFDPAVRMVSDWDFAFRLVRRFSPRLLCCVDEPLTAYRIWPGSMSSDHESVLSNGLLLMDQRLLEDMHGLGRRLWRRRIRAWLLYGSALTMREQGDPRCLRRALASLACWPLFGPAVPAHRHKVAAHMLWQALSR